MTSKQQHCRPPKRTLATIAVAIAIAFASPGAQPEDATWVGGTGNWTVDNNWTPAAAPNSASTDVIIKGNVAASALVSLDVTRPVGRLTIDPGDTLTVFNGARLDMNGDASIDGILILGSASSSAELQMLGGNPTISGSGTLILGNSSSGTNRIFVQGQTNNRIIFESGLTVQGAGDLGAGMSRFTNRGMIEANQPVTLSVTPSNIPPDAFINEGTLRAVNGATLHLAGVTYANTGGLIQAQDASFVNLSSGAAITGGTLATIGTGVIRALGTAITPVLLHDMSIGLGSMLDVQNGTQLDVKGTLTNSGTVRINSTGDLTDLRIVGDTTITGHGSILLTHSTQSRIFADVTVAGASHLTIGSGQTIRGAGNIGAGQSRITNDGTIQADSDTALTIQSSLGFTNRGQIVVDSEKTLAVAGSASFVQNAVGASTMVFGTMTTAPSFEIQAGTLAGTGTIVGSVVNTGGAVAPGSSPGTLTISGDYTQGPDGKLTLELNGMDQGSTYDWLNVSGKATLDGTALLDFGFTPTVGASFVVLTAGAGVTGKFSEIMAPSGWIIKDSYLDNKVTLTVAAIPEPEAYALMLAGLVFVAWAARRQEKGRTRISHVFEIERLTIR